jgi:hypothetical protein
VKRRLLVALAWLGLALSAAAHAETYRCEGPDGKTLFTSDRSLCPRARLHESRGQIQRAPGGPELPPARPRETLESRARRAHADEAEASVWRTRRARAEAELDQARGRLEALHQVAGWCNRGHEVWATDADGLRHGVDCAELEAQQKALQREERRLEAYLAAGLEEECRRAGCLPGWIR